MAVDVDLLKGIPYFAGLSDADLQSVASRMFEQSFERGDMILMEEDPAEAIYFVVSGAVKVFKTSIEGKEQILCLLRAGESFNDVPILDGGPNLASAVAITPVVLYGMTKTDLEGLLRENPKVAMNVIRVLSKKVRHFVSMVEDLSFRDVTSRVAKLLLEYATDHGTPEEGSHRPRLTQQEMAAMVGTAREVVGRSLKALEEEGAIRMERHRIVVTNRKTLQQIGGVA
ncbi:MAG: Crp/Fnr family transcriptional regulator [Dehalococcoidia bacterium]|nr:Crp/Fnr family transcriptional regulator [Dehalococcoidia bacterium]